ncbi:MAG: hypothetical protein M1821_004047 [Bathelium mastoideum]|nr:MAG: hypothetical protein M1821_004047 [Bathelium mastoideum]KAI9691119.1 MAG: hypothetical protein M1822_008739 [Bathelium mastoideum]
MSSIKTVAVAGASGNLGPSVVDQLLKAGFSVSALTRQNSNSTPPSGVKAIPVDYTSVDSLTAALKGHDAVVSTLNPDVVDQTPIIDAAIAAGVSRYLPSEFGCDTLNANVRKLPVFAAKAKTVDYISQKAKEGKISYTLVITGPFLDWCLPTPFLVNFEGPVADIFDGGDNKVSTTMLADIGRAVAGVLKHPAETENRAVYVESAAVSQNQLLAIASKVTGKKFETRPASTVEHEKQAHEKFKQGDMSSMVTFILRAVWGGQEFEAKFEKPLDNKLFGVNKLTEKQLEEVVKENIKA